MFQDQILQDHLESSSVIHSRAAVIAEWNMNIAENVLKVGNYRYRPFESQSKYKTLVNNFDAYDQGFFYTNATDADITIDGGFKDDGTPQTFLSKKQKESMLYSLEDCLYKFRPRSGINKLRYFDSRFSHFVNEDMATRPRYYIADKDDKFKYWTSYRTETSYKYAYPTYVSYGAEPTFSYYNNQATLVTVNGEPVANTERGISKKIDSSSNVYTIDDAVPFVVYKDQVPANRIVVKMQTSVGTTNLGPFANASTSVDDPFYGYSNQTTPVKWKIQYLENDSWVDAAAFDKNSVRKDGSPIIPADGYVEISYGLIIPDIYSDIFIKAEELTSDTLLPETAPYGSAYLVKSTEASNGLYYIFTGTEYETFVPKYGWDLIDSEMNSFTHNVTDLTSPVQYVSSIDGRSYYREFTYLSGLRLVVETMNVDDCSFDLIEMSPRLSVDLADKTKSLSVKKIASDLGSTGMPVSQLLASVGSLDIFDYDEAFNKNNPGSIINKYLAKNVQIKFYEIISEVINPDTGIVLSDYYIPIKTMYCEGFPEADSRTRTLSLSLRDLYFYFESMTAPQLLMQNVSVSSAICTLLDSIGFSNYVFKKIDGREEVIPYFYIAPDKTIAEVLNDIAVSTQSAMFFDEYNNLVVMSREYMIPSDWQRSIDMTLYGSIDQTDSGVLENESTNYRLANIIEISSQNSDIYNDGQINYTNRSIERSYGTIKQASMIDRDKTWIYKPSLLWEVSGSESTKSTGGTISSQSSYVLGAIPLNSELTANVPVVENFVLKNNTMDFGEGIYWLGRYNGYFYANGEIIKYDAVQYSIPGISLMDPNNPNVVGNNVWVTNTQEYQRYFSKLPFNGKIYPTGLVRIFSEPNYETVNGETRLKNGAVARHGRGQFGTPVVAHKEGLSSSWSDNAYVRGCKMKSKYLFNDALYTYELEGAASSAKTITVDDISRVKVGQVVNVWSIDSFTPIAKDKITRVVTVNTTQDPETELYSFTISETPTTTLSDSRIQLIDDVLTENGTAGYNKTLAEKSTRNGIIRNFLSSSYISETDLGSKTKASVETGTIQSSAFVINGPAMSNDYKPIDFLSYVYKPLENRFKHFGTRMRIVGQIDNSETKAQTPFGSTEYFASAGGTKSTTSGVSVPSQSVTIGGSSGGLAIMVNPATNQGYYFEIVALTENDVEAYAAESPIHNVVFYKILKDVDSTDAIPVKLWGGLSQILVDDGKFTGQYRMTGEEKPTVYDLAVEYKDIGSTRRFYLYINDKLIAIVDDTQPLSVYNNMALFVRGAARCMFENVYAITNNYSQNSAYTADTPVASVFESSEVSSNESFKKYAMSGIVRSVYLSGISTLESPKYNMYFEEFGTIMREASHFNIKYDKAYPALHAKLAPTFNRLQGYTVSAFTASSYGAEFLVFNATDTALSLDSTSGNYLRILGVTFTQESESKLSVDDYFSKRSDYSNPTFDRSTTATSETDVLTTSVIDTLETYRNIKASRVTYGRKDFSITAPYIQSYDDANKLMEWLVSKTMKPRKSVGIKLFSTPTLQLGDLVNIDFADSNNYGISSSSSRFVVYNIEYSRSVAGPEMIVYLSEVM